MAEALPQMAWITRPDGWNIYFNQQWVKYTGLTLEESYGHGWNTPFHPDDKQRAWDAWQHAVQTDGVYSLECRLRGADGVYRWWLIRGVSLHDASGKVINWFGTCTDVQELKEKEDSLRASEAALTKKAAELERSNAELEQFAYVASHDLREPLRVITNFSGLLEKKYKRQLDEAADRYIGHIVDSAARMSALIGDLLVYARVGQAESTRTRTDLNRVLDDVRKSLASSIDESGTTFAYQTLPDVHANATLMQQLFQNLISNSIKFRREGVPPRIEIAAKRNDGEWLLSISDNGIGIERQYADRIFEIFQRLHSRSEYPGTGIGLAICRKIVERHGGRIWMQSQLGQGTTFYFTVPMNSAEAQASLPRLIREGHRHAAEIS